MYFLIFQSVCWKYSATVSCWNWPFFFLKGPSTCLRGTKQQWIPTHLLSQQRVAVSNRSDWLTLVVLGEFDDSCLTCWLSRNTDGHAGSLSLWLSLLCSLPAVSLWFLESDEADLFVVWLFYLQHFPDNQWLQHFLVQAKNQCPIWIRLITLLVTRNRWNLKVHCQSQPALRKLFQKWK